VSYGFRAIINQLIGAVIGTVVSFVMSWYFYKKADFPSRVMGEMTENLLAMSIQSRLGGNFDFHEEVPKDKLPKDLCTPHITQFWRTAETLQQGESILVLFRLEDTGMNFEGSEKVEVTDTSSKISFPATREGQAYYSCKINFPDNTTVGQHTVTFRFTDEKRKSYTQSIKFDVTPRSP
jgi:hypothetical protein